MNDLEFMRELFKDSRLHIGIGVITQFGLATDASTMRVSVNLLPENREIVAQMTWGDVYHITQPELDDLVIVAFVDGHPDNAFVLKQVSTADEKIPTFARSGHSVAYSRPGKKYYIGSDTKIGLGRKDVEPTEALVLGTVLKNYLTAIDTNLKAIIAAIETNPPITTAPGDPTTIASLTAALELVKAQMLLDKTQYLTTASSNILSQIAFTERGA